MKMCTCVCLPPHPFDSQGHQHVARDRPVRHAAEEDVLDRFRNNPRTSSRLVANQAGCSQSTVIRIAHSNNLHPFKFTKVQHLRPEDPPRRLDFCHWIIPQQQQNPDFMRSILVTDEKGFSREGTFNAHNQHYWAEENPRQKFLRGYQQKFSVNVWAGILGDNLLGPYILPHRLNGDAYLIFLQEVLPELLEDVAPLQLNWNHWFQHDGCPAHYAAHVRAHLNTVYPDRWIGRGGPVAWPARSPDLTPLDFYLWGAMEDHVYATPVESEEDLIARVVMAGEAIRQDPGVFARVRAAWLERCQKCVEQNGGHVEHVL